MLKESVLFSTFGYVSVVYPFVNMNQQKIEEKNCFFVTKSLVQDERVTNFFSRPVDKNTTRSEFIELS